MKKISILTAVICLVFSTQAQLTTHSLYIGFANGISSLHHKPQIGSEKLKWACQTGIGYTYLYNNTVGFSVGLEYAYSQNEYRLSSLSQMFETGDFEGEIFLQKNTLKNYTEKQRIHYLNIPFMFRYEFNSFFLEVGPILGFNLATQASGEADFVKVSGYYYDAIEDFENIIELGFMSTSDYKATNKLKLGVNLAAGLEFGYFFSIFNSGKLGLSMVFQYGLLNLAKQSDTKEFIDTKEVNGIAQIHVNSMANSRLNPTSSNPIVGKMNPLILGLKISYRFQINSLAKYTFYKRGIEEAR